MAVQSFEVEIISLASFYISGYVYSPLIVMSGALLWRLNSAKMTDFAEFWFVSGFEPCNSLVHHRPTEN